MKYYGEVEFWIASTKVIAIVGWLIYAFCMVCGAGKTGPVGFRYWRNGYAWGDGMIVLNNGKYAISFINGLINAVFTFQGTELVAVTAGEASPRAIRSAIKSHVQNFSVLRFVYAFHWSFGSLQRSKTYPRWWIYKKLSIPYCYGKFGTKVLPHIFNAVIVTTIISAGNSNVYSGSRILYGLAQAGVALNFSLKLTKVVFHILLYCSLLHLVHWDI